jgi:hypothetical protein
MRKIDKTCSFSTVYKTWEESLEANGQAHPKYDSSAGEYYRDIMMQLYLCQDGLCAYTEQSLCPPAVYAATNWKDGSYTAEMPAKKPLGSLDHFDPSLKTNQAWLWSNFFMVNFEVNSSKIKGSKPVDPILKPDREGYDPFKFLEYDIQFHTFRPSEELDTLEFEKVKSMINILGINHIDEDRKDLLNKTLRLIYTRQWTWDEAEAKTRQFPTALKMCRMQLENDQQKFRQLIFAGDDTI